MRINSNESLTAISEIEIRSDCSLLDIRKMGTPPISGLVRDQDKSECYKLIQAMIILLNQYIGTTWSDPQIMEVSKEFYSKYFYWTQADLKNFIRKCKAMEFEKILSATQFSPLIFMNWAAQYDQDWMNVSVEQSLLIHEQMTYDAKRETEIYNHERAQSERKKDQQERIITMREGLERQSELISKLTGETKL